MKYCSRCGTSAEDVAAFCPSCGSAMETQTGAQPNVQPQNCSGYQTGYAPEFVPPSAIPEPPVVHLIKEEGAKPLFLVACILYSVAVFMSIFSDTISDVYSSYGISYSYDINPVNLLACIGLWIFYAMCKKPADGFPPKTGAMTVFRVMGILNVVAYSILIACVSIAGVLLAAGAGMGGLEELIRRSGLNGITGAGTAFISGFFGVLIVIAIGMLVLMLIYNVKVLGCIKNIKNSLITGMPQGKLSVFVIVITIIMSAMSVLGSFKGSSASMISSLSSGVAGIFIACCMISYNKRLSVLTGF
jgi:hypothetical protein